MPIRSNSPMEQAQELYVRMQNECIDYEPAGAGMLRPRLNFTALVGLVQQEFDSSQLLIQLLGQPSGDVGNEERAQWRQHGLFPDSKALGVSLRLREKPAHYLESWHLAWYVLPQLADRSPEALPPPGVFPLRLLVAD